MQCKCGYSFRDPITHKQGHYKPYAVVDDKDYRTFIRLEIKAKQAKGREAKLKAILRSSQYVGCLLKCPKCARLKFLKPGSRREEYYAKEK